MLEPPPPPRNKSLRLRNGALTTIGLLHYNTVAVRAWERKFLQRRDDILPPEAETTGGIADHDHDEEHDDEPDAFDQPHPPVSQKNKKRVVKKKKKKVVWERKFLQRRDDLPPPAGDEEDDEEDLHDGASTTSNLVAWVSSFLSKFAGTSTTVAAEDGTAAAPRGSVDEMKAVESSPEGARHDSMPPVERSAAVEYPAAVSHAFQEHAVLKDAGVAEIGDNGMYYGDE